MHRPLSISRRNLLAMALAVGAYPTSGRAAPPSNDYRNQPSLRELGERSGIKYGLTEATYSFPAQRGYYEQLAKECNLFSPSAGFNWKGVERKRGVRDYGNLDAVVKFMRDRNVKIEGHVLLWFRTIPPWVAALESESDINQAIEGFIGETVSRYKGSVALWDVVNEQVRPDGGGDGLRPSFYVQKLGPGFMKRAFALARAADSQALLCYNDFGFEYLKPDQQAKRAAFLRLLQKFRDENAEIDVIGLQSHLDADLALDLDGLSAFIRQIKALGYKIAITELDVLDKNLMGDEEVRDRAVAAHVKDYLTCIATELKPISITSWGFTDSRTWLTMWHNRRDGRALRPLPFDDQFNRKDQWGAIAEVMRSFI